MFAVIFEVNPHAALWDDYLRHAAILRPELQRIEGFIDNERFRSLAEPGWLVSLSIWRDEKALVRWRTHAMHHEFQGKGRDEILAGYHLRVGEIVADTGTAVMPPMHRFDTTETGQAKFLTLTERPVDADTGWESITRAGHGLTMLGWPDQAAASAGTEGTGGRHRSVRVIRDYGMHDRHEAPQYYPPAKAR
jgi:heme-degrading monooxygenase HmoA